MKIHRINPCKRWSDVTVFNGIAQFVEVPEQDLTQDIQGQTRQVLEQAKETLKLVNSDPSRVLSVTLFITDFDNLEAMNEVWDDWFPEGCAPSQACVKAELANPGYLIEMAFSAAAGDGFMPE